MRLSHSDTYHYYWQRRLEGGKRDANIVNSQSGYKKLYVALVAYVYQQKFRE